MHAGRVLTVDHPDAVCAARGTDSLEEAFVDHLLEVAGGAQEAGEGEIEAGGSAPEARQRVRRASSTTLRV